MTYLIFNSLAEAEATNKKINDYMIQNFRGYDAKQWSRIITDNNGNYAIYVKSKDERKPVKALELATRNKIVKALPDEFFTRKMILDEETKTPNFTEKIKNLP